ncbi:MAG: ATP-grasp domain-containing protein [bacterium]
MKRIGLIGRHDDPEVQLLKARIEDLGATATAIDFWHYPKFTSSTLDLETIVYDGIDLTEFDAFYLRQIGFFSPIPEKEYTKQEWEELYGKFNDQIANDREVLSYKESLIQLLGNIRPIINPYICAFYHKLKPLQYWKLISSGLKVPEFIAGNDFSTLKDQVEKADWVIKPLTGGFVSFLDRESLLRIKPTLRQKPVIAQKRVSGKMLRVFVLGESIIVSCELVHEPSSADARLSLIAIKRFDLPANIEGIPIRACKALGMVFAGVDIILESENQAYVLECNPAPIFRSFEVQTGVEISKALANYLLEVAK